MLVSDILKSKGREVVTAPPSLPVADAARLLSEKRIGSLLILDRGTIAGSSRNPTSSAPWPPRARPAWTGRCPG